MVQAHVSEEKKKTVAELKELIKEYPIIGAVNMENMNFPFPDPPQYSE